MIKSKNEFEGVWRTPGEESLDLYPGVVVHDDRVTGSITIGQSRLALWAVVGDLVRGGYSSVKEGYEPLEESEGGLGEEGLAGFLYDLLEVRGEFARLLLILADEERREREADSIGDEEAWFNKADSRARVREGLLSCLKVLYLLDSKDEGADSDDIWARAFKEMERRRMHGGPVDESVFIGLTKSSGGD